MALKGGRCNSDAVDNSAGVNTSDVEVNIKIALSPAVRSGKLDEAARLELLRSMTDDVAGLVLRNNYQQTLAISLEASRGLDNLGNQLRLMAELEERGLLDRTVEGMPDNAAIEARAAGGRGLTRSEIGTLLAFAKIALSDDLRASAVPDDPYLSRELFRYFPELMRKRFAAEIEAHRLRREIIATQLANSLINRGGPTLLVAARDRTGASVAELTRAYAAARNAFGLRDLHSEIDALDAKISGRLQLELYAIVQDVLADRIGWFTRNLPADASLEEVVAHYRAALEELAAALPPLLPRETVKAIRDTEQRLKSGRVPETLAERLAMLPTLARAANVISIADRRRQDGRRIREGLLRRLRPLRLRPHRPHDRRDRLRRLLREPGAAEGARQSGDRAPRSGAEGHRQRQRRQCRRVGEGRGRTRVRDGGAGGKDHLRPPPVDGEGDDRGEFVVGTGAGADSWKMRVNPVPGKPSRGALRTGDWSCDENGRVGDWRSPARLPGIVVFCNPLSRHRRTRRQLLYRRVRGWASLTSRAVNFALTFRTANRGPLVARHRAQPVCRRPERDARR